MAARTPARHALLALSLVARASGHAALSFPRPRNALDGSLAPWSSWAYPCDAAHEGDACAITFCENGKDCQGSCPIPSYKAKGALNASNGQSCYWFSNGCTIGCAACDGTLNHVGHGGQRFLYKGMSQATLDAHNLTIDNPFSPVLGDMVLNATTAASLDIKPNCDAPKLPSSTICDPNLRTVNTQAVCGSKDDVYYYSPWRAPGSAPIIDACGSAGGRFPGQGTGGAGAQFQNSSKAKAGDRGSRLPPMAPQATWRAGDAVEVGWVLMANHGGGYAYRLAPADAPLTEESFRKMPLDFVGQSALRWDGDRSSQLAFDGWRVAEATTPAGSMWSKNPIPSGLWERMGPQFEPVCDESRACKDGFARRLGGPQGVCRCSGYSNGGPLLPNLEIVDNVRIPADLKPGKYVLQWRWDCEESDQVWASCADVEIAEPWTW